MEKRVESAKKYLALVRKKFQENSSKYDEFLSIMKAYKDQKLDTESVCKKVQELFKGNKNLLAEFNKLIPSNFRLNLEARPQYQEAIEYMRRVKEETKDTPSIYNEFIQVLKKYQDKSMSIDQVNVSVRSIMSGYPVLVESFKSFLPNYNEESSSSISDSDVVTKPTKRLASPQATSHEKYLIDIILEPVQKQDVIFFKRLKKIMMHNSMPNTDFYLELSKSFELYVDCVITKRELAEMVEPLFKLTNYQNFLNGSHRRILKDDAKEITAFIQGQLTEMFEVFKVILATRECTRRKTGLFFRPLSDFDTAKSKKLGHSYLEIQRPRVFKDRPNPEINELWVSVPYGSEDLSFRNFRKNAYEDALFKCEDERFEIEMTIETSLYTLRMLERALDDYSSLSADQQKNFKLDERIFSKFRLKPIYCIYSEHAQKIIEMLKTNPVRSLPVVISRIKQKIEAWKKNTKSESEKSWKDTIEKNFFKSLDHRSFYFKQHEKKMINPKSFLIEAKTRASNKDESKSLLRKYLKKELTQQNFEFLGGSRNTLFFNSFAGLSGGVVHKIQEGFADSTIEDFVELDKAQTDFKYLNSPDYATLPHFRLLFSCESVMIDALRMVMYAVDKVSQTEREKIDKWTLKLFQEFIGAKIPIDVLCHKIEDFFDGIEIIIDGQSLNRDDYVKRAIQLWIQNESYNNMEIGEGSISENMQDPMLVIKEDFKRYLPLLRDDIVMYGSQHLYCFIRFFYDIYERLLKIKIILSQSGKEYEYKKLEFGVYEFDKNVEEEYNSFLRCICLMISSSFEPSKYEDRCRALLGNDSYVFFSLDKLISNTAKSLIGLATDEASQKLLGLFSKYSKVCQNEEMYLCDVLESPTLGQMFRLHWNKKFGILSVTFIENPYEKINEQSVKNSQKYKKSFLVMKTHDSCFDEFRNFNERLGKYISNNPESSLYTHLFFYNNTSYGMVENSYRFYPIPSGEDFIINSGFYSSIPTLEFDSEAFACQDKNSLFQKLSEHSERSFTSLRASILSQQ